MNQAKSRAAAGVPLSMTPKAIRRRKMRQQAKLNKTNVKSQQRKNRRQKKSRVFPEGDARVATQQNPEISLTSQLKAITINKFLTADSVVWIARGFISKAFERGFAGAASSPPTPYFASVYIANLLASYANAAPVPVTQLPYWLLCLCHAISPKTVPFEHGRVAYKFSVEGTLPFLPPETDMIGYQPYGYRWTTSPSTGPKVNGFPTAVDTGTAYTDELGQNAFQELCQFMESNTIDEKMKRVTALVPSSTVTPFVNDCSPYAVFSQAEGLGATGFGGGIAGQLQNEVEITCPLLALASSGEDSFIAALPTRFYNKTAVTAGDPCFLGASMSTMFLTKQLYEKHPMRLKPIDFLEFGDVLAQWVAGIQQAYLTDVTQAQTKTVATANVQCPLTLQEMLLCLRNTMMGAFKESIAATQGIYPFKPQSDVDNEFVAYTSGGSTCPIETLDMQLPMPLIENIRALVARKIQSPKAEKEVYWYCPVLGQYAFDALKSSDYVVTYTGSDGAVTADAFTAGAIFRQTEVNAKGEKTVKMLAEAVINLVDGGSGTDLVAINDPQQLRKLIGFWNDWLKTSGVASNSVQLGTMGTEKGISILCSISTSRIWVPVSTLVRGRNEAGSNRERGSSKSRDDSKQIVDTRFEKARFKGLLTSVYGSKQAIVTTHQCTVLAAPFEQVLDTWILPINDDELIINVNSTVVQRWQFIMGEPHSTASSSGDNGTLLSTIHSSYASKMTKSKLSQADDWTEFFNQMAKLGRGGILTGLVAGLVGKFIPGLGGIASTIAEALPI